VFNILNVTPTFGISILQPNKRGTNVRRAMLFVVNNNWLKRTSRHEDFRSRFEPAYQAVEHVPCVAANLQRGTLMAD
jgi:hypothetical protein